MKYLIILLFICYNGYGQTKPNGTFVGFEPDGSTTKIGDTAYRYIAHTWNKEMLILKSTKKYPNGTWTHINQFDTSKIYWKKYTYWDNKMNAELQRLNKSGHAKDISKALVRYQDSAIKYKLLLDKLKK